MEGELGQGSKLPLPSMRDQTKLTRRVQILPPQDSTALDLAVVWSMAVAAISIFVLLSDSRAAVFPRTGGSSIDRAFPSRYT